MDHDKTDTLFDDYPDLGREVKVLDNNVHLDFLRLFAINCALFDSDEHDRCRKCAK